MKFIKATEPFSDSKTLCYTHEKLLIIYTFISKSKQHYNRIEDIATSLRGCGDVTSVTNQTVFIGPVPTPIFSNYLSIQSYKSSMRI